MKRFVSVLLAGVVACAGCGEKAAPAASADPPPAARPTDLVVDEAAMASVKIETLVERPVARTLTIPGKIQFDEDRLAHILAPLAGQVVNLRVKVGDAVQQGSA